MRDNEKLTPHTEVVAVEFNNFLDFVDRLSDDQKQVLTQKLIGQNSPLTVVLGNHNVINNSVVGLRIVTELERLTNSVEIARAIGGELLKEKLADLKLYRLQLRRILRFTLYFLEIEADGKILHKIGVTSRAIGDRISEIERDLQQHYSDTSIDVLGTWQHRGNVELYFKHRYKEFNYRIGKLTEYYRFQDVLKDTVTVGNP